MAEKRRRKVTDPFQWRIFFRILCYGLIYQATVWNLMFCWWLMRHEGSLLAQYRAFSGECYPMLLCVTLLAPAFAWDAVKYCHRIAGPIYRFRVTARDIAAGKPVRRVQLRRGDELIGLQDDFNAMLDALAGQNALQLIDDANIRPASTERDGTALEPAEPALTH